MKGTASAGGEPSPALAERALPPMLILLRARLDRFEIHTARRVDSAGGGGVARIRHSG